jgi:hypothetical protein
VFKTEEPETANTYVGKKGILLFFRMSDMLACLCVVQALQWARSFTKCLKGFIVFQKLTLNLINRPTMLDTVPCLRDTCLSDVSGVGSNLVFR